MFPTRDMNDVKENTMMPCLPRLNKQANTVVVVVIQGKHQNFNYF
jgi:hypothetical protein